MRRLACFVMVAMPMMAGCNAWPSWSSIEQPGTLVPAGTDPRDLVPPVNYAGFDESGENDTPAPALRTELTADTGVVASGNLDGIGWSDAATAEALTDPACGEVGSRSPLAEGDYIGDVDFYVVDVVDAGILCVAGQMPTEEYGWDLLLFELDDCSIPLAAVQDEGWPDGVLGFETGGTLVEWSHAVEAGSSYGVMIAAYAPNEPETVLSYQLSMALIGAGDGATTPLCPLPPSSVGSE